MTDQQDDKQITLEQIKAAQRLLAVKKARESLIDFMRLTMPDTKDPDDATLSRYEITPQAKLLCEALEKVERGEILRLCVSMPPQHGKSQVISIGYPAWAIGRNPWKGIMLATYSQDFANEFGGKVREIITSPQYRQVFPDFAFRKGSKAKDAMSTTQGGHLYFLGRGGSGTGKRADVFIVDDPLKDDKEAQSATIRRDLWNWFNSVADSRCHNDSAIIIVHTRWHEDDLIGRMVDPDHPEHDPKIAKEWTYINIPAVVSDKAMADALGITLEPQTDPDIIDQFGAKPISALWPGRKGLKLFASVKRRAKRIFEALYQGKPAPDDGDYFKREWIIPYQPHELPKALNKYCFSDHAISADQKNDKSCFGTIGVDDNGVLWLLPDLYWEREDDTNVIVENMIDMMRRHQPQTWWAERGHISKSILPVLRKEMLKQKVYCLVDDSIVPSKDKRTRARSTQALMSMHQIRFPTFAPWWEEAQAELLKFDNGTHDDFVDMLAWAGICLMRQVSAPKPVSQGNVIRTGTLAWVKNRTKLENDEKLRRNAGGM